MNGNPERLPRGRHRLSREQVVASQRARILTGFIETVAAQGYVHTSVADVLRVAGVSRETFYQQFTSKDDCFMAAYDAAVGVVLGGIGDSLGGDGAALGTLERLDGALGAYLETLAAEPAYARVFLIEVYAAGPEALARRAESQQRFVTLVAALLGAETDQERFVAEALVAATSALVTARIVASDWEGLAALRGPLVALTGQLIAGQR
ncbi:TetR/AcrR family transcriptional regulator [Paraconexibacter antarcticus]|uniref:TetR/AcrR family transcriptional regulator n=1 Tax=Paraconexibacter antarcticus TaxID=2949664 RepID=A0ABY5DRN1_9ACTN|nr:TetR/AcrR family transcriptional regulator [Paraconexibacter antarcticus]UTI63569.1 TetR/AcrR family transcriptional regulator [Paraconexibacter antarcticus]